jgi:hypothetical protein
MQAIKPLIISPTILGASREIQCFLQIRTFGDGHVGISSIIATMNWPKLSPRRSKLAATWQSQRADGGLISQLWFTLLAILWRKFESAL